MRTLLSPCLGSTLLGIAVCAAPAALARQEADSLRARFERLDDAGDLDGIAALFRAHEGEVLYAIDEYLEAALALREADAAAGDATSDVPAARAAEIAVLHARALRAALAADRAFERSIFSDYASASIGWDGAELARFRRGQHAYDEARDAVQQRRFEDAQRLARESSELLEPLGDWWGTALGLSAEGAALAELGRGEEALARRARARLLHQQLGLAGSELRDLVAMAELLARLDRPVRAHVALERGLALAAELGVGAARIDLLRTRAALEERAGDLDAARATLLEVKALLEAEGAAGTRAEHPPSDSGG